MSDLSSVLDRIDSVKQVSSSIKADSQSKRQKVEENGVKNGVKVAEESSFKPNDGSDNTEDGKSVTTVQAPVWYEFIDASSGSSYYHNYITNETSWDKPDNFVPYTPPAVVPLATSSLPYYPIPAETSYTDYSAVAYFNQNDGRFGGVGHSHWEQKGLPTDRSARQLSKYIDLNELQRNRDETKARKAQIQNEMKGVDWKKYKEEKKELKKRKRLAWMLED